MSRGEETGELGAELTFWVDEEGELIEGLFEGRREGRGGGALEGRPDDKIELTGDGERGGGRCGTS